MAERYTRRDGSRPLTRLSDTDAASPYRPARETEEARQALVARTRVVATIAAAHAVAVDRDGIFPDAAIAAAKREGLFALLVPAEFGGEGASLGAVAEVCYTLGQACASTAMIIAMHQSALACVIRHHGGTAWHGELLRRVARENLMFASSTTEGSGGGNVRSSDAALVIEGDTLRFARAATVMSYGEQADGIVSVARRDPDAAASDQALVVLLKEDYRLTPTGSWDTLGMRGTCGAGFALEAITTPDCILPVGYDKIHAQTMVPYSHVTWAALWAGIAAAAVQRAQMFTRTAARKAGGQMPPGLAQATRANATLRTLRALVAATLADVERDLVDPTTMAALDRQAGLNLFKVEASEAAVETVMLAMRACGLSGYRNDGDFTLGRHLRDVLSAPVMIHNERIMTNIASAALMAGIPQSLRGDA